MSKFSHRLKRIFMGAAAAGSMTVSSGCVSAGGLQGRPLTHGETEMARSVFGDSVDYSKVHIYNGAPKVGGIFRLTSTGLAAITPNGDIYIVDKNAQVTDLSTASPAKRKLLIHEMTHVWQHQQGRNVEGEAVYLYFKHGFKYDKAYAYDIDGNLKFESMNIEQQAQLVEDYFALRDMPRAQWPADREAKIARFEAVLKPHLPLTADSSRNGPPPKMTRPPHPSAPPPHA